MKLRNKGFLLTIAAIAVVLIMIGVIFNLSQTKNDLQIENWDASAYNSSDLTIRGIVYDIKTNVKIEGAYTCHVFPALMYVNITQVVWASDQLMSGMGILELQNDTWNHKDTIIIAYDKPDEIQISNGQLIETSGCYFTKSISVYAMKLVIAEGINESYLKLI
jgi:hypothetical protein